jgi:beta-barrel assembly-enhancing protease
MRWRLVLVAVLTAACATTTTAPPSPPLALDAQEQVLRARVGVHDDPALSALLGRVTAALVADGERRPEVVVLRDPTIAAFALPGGGISLHAGLLARLENEAQLATVLARAVSHAVRPLTLDPEAGAHAVDKAILAMPEAVTAALATPDPAVEVLSPTTDAILGRRLGTVYVAAVAGYGRGLEAEADAGAVRRLARAGYDLREAPRTFERLRREAKAGGLIERFFLGHEAVLGERIASFTRLGVANAAAAGTIRTTPEFDKVAATVARDNARLELRVGRFRAAQEQIDRALVAAPADGRAHLTLGDLLRLRAQRARGAAERDDLAGRALAAYQRAGELDPALVEVARAIGLLYYQQGQRESAREAFTRYLASQPDPVDAARVREYLATLEAK